MDEMLNFSCESRSFSFTGVIWWHQGIHLQRFRGIQHGFMGIPTLAWGLYLLAAVNAPTQPMQSDV